MIKKLKQTKLYKLIKYNPDILTIPFVLVGWWFMALGLYWLDPSSSVASLDYAGNFIVALFYIMAMTFFVKGFIRFHLPWLWEYLTEKETHTKKTRIHNDFTMLRAWQRVFVFIFLFSFLLALLYLLVSIVK
jgi:polyferredoxin